MKVFGLFSSLLVVFLMGSRITFAGRYRDESDLRKQQLLNRFNGYLNDFGYDSYSHYPEQDFVEPVHQQFQLNYPQQTTNGIADKLMGSYSSNYYYGDNQFMDSVGSSSSFSSILGKMSSFAGGSFNDETIIPGFALVAVSLLLLYLVTSTATTGRRSASDNELGPISDGAEYQIQLDGPTWLSLVHELWEQDGVSRDPSCAQHTLCRLNALASEAPEKAGWAVSLSSLPLSYLLHHRHEAGFGLYMEAAMMGRSGANCSLLYSGCARIN